MRRIEPCPKPSQTGPPQAPDQAGRLPEECASFLRQIGSPDAFPEGLAQEILPAGIHGETELQEFLEAYQNRFLIPLEIPVITRARFHAAQGHARELIELDAELAVKPIWPALASASRRIGRAHLQRLRPLRDERTVQRYLAAVTADQATGWHTVVFGLTLAIFSWPLRHGLLTYGRETLTAMAMAARPLKVPESTCVDMLNVLFLRLPDAIEQALALDGFAANTAPPEKKNAGQLQAEPSGIAN